MFGIRGLNTTNRSIPQQLYSFGVTKILNKNCRWLLNELMASSNVGNFEDWPGADSQLFRITQILRNVDELMAEIFACKIRKQSYLQKSVRSVVFMPACSKVDGPVIRCPHTVPHMRFGFRQFMNLGANLTSASLHY